MCTYYQVPAYVPLNRTSIHQPWCTSFVELEILKLKMVSKKEKRSANKYTFKLLIALKTSMAYRLHDINAISY